MLEEKKTNKKGRKKKLKMLIFILVTMDGRVYIFQLIDRVKANYSSNSNENYPIKAILTPNFFFIRKKTYYRVQLCTSITIPRAKKMICSGIQGTISR